MATPSSGFRGTQVFNTYSYDGNFDTGNSPPSSIITGSCYAKLYVTVATGSIIATVAKPGGGTVKIGVFKKKASSSSINAWTDVDLVGDGSGSGTVSYSFTAGAPGEQYVIAGDSVTGYCDDMAISAAPNGNVATPSLSVDFTGVDHLNISCSTTGALIMYRRDTTLVWTIYTAPVALGSGDSTHTFYAQATKQDYYKSAIGSIQYMEQG